MRLPDPSRTLLPAFRARKTHGKPCRKNEAPVNNETRKLMKLLHLEADEIYHVFCLALCIGMLDGHISDEEGEVLTRIGFGLGLTPEDIEALGQNAKDAIQETSPADVIAFSLATLKTKLSHDQLQGVKQILKFVAVSDHRLARSEQQMLDVVDEIWPE